MTYRGVEINTVVDLIDESIFGLHVGAWLVWSLACIKMSVCSLFVSHTQSVNPPIISLDDRAPLSSTHARMHRHTHTHTLMSSSNQPVVLQSNLWVVGQQFSPWVRAERPTAWNSKNPNTTGAELYLSSAIKRQTWQLLGETEECVFERENKREIEGDLNGSETCRNSSV